MMSTSKSQHGQNSGSVIETALSQVSGYLSRGAKPSYISLDEGTVFELLSNSRRRALIRLVDEKEEAITLSEAVKEIAALEENISKEEVSDEARKRIYVSLYQTHLDKLEEDNVLVVDWDEKFIRPGDQFSDVLHVLQLTSSA